MASVVRGPIEVRIARLEEPADDDCVLEFTGWPTTTPTSRIVPLAGFSETIADELRTTSPLADDVRIPVLRTAAAPAVRQIYAAAVLLGQDQIPTVRVEAATVEIRWTPGDHSRVELTDPPAARTSPG
jgi:hypothetical protein